MTTVKLCFFFERPKLYVKAMQVQSQNIQFPNTARKRNAMPRADH